MIPTTLGECDVNKILPLSVKEQLHKLDEFIVENSKTARAFLKKMSIPIPQNKLKIHILNEIFDKRNYSVSDSYYFINVVDKINVILDILDIDEDDSRLNAYVFERENVYRVKAITKDLI